ncbi:Uncharacterised protein [Mycobacteroides abscessus subsp. bolletii]|uniref:Uncharacterized protein n=1 Tax=Mycobacteroides abscessus subsp. bolletii TaxID=319705 RepID=A0A9Q7WJX4_9MYCO|nr:hypothetical protein [Mycobacteroides abscessus]SHU60925.1 Uncharacterised protein [Mycobacteroides abscessus subsp. bolletii]SHU85616.1 Uncharacterised protein [Mycobacteroides abscessus subsp. bolletii]SHX59381.1 Uncharacterised protein [Mycobacteroides abscessus subsp. bolletii]SKK07371.1 Uncharacterised protein [Mycobacteroides abscessus subsp. bolletii]SKM21252.1 Uncharacterised protein [Mycobacteroides abscessus subsp. bolletii]
MHEFISLRRLNRYVTVVIDSGKRSPHSHINNTKKRIRDEISDGEGPGLVWITKGRTIENYVPKHILEAALKYVHPDRKAFVANDGLHADVVGKLSTQDAFRPDKVKVAAEICRRWEKDWTTSTSTRR